MCLLTAPKGVRRSFRSLAFRVVATRAKLGRNLWNTLHNPRSEQSAVMYVGSFNPLMAFVVCDVSLRRPGRIASPE